MAVNSLIVGPAGPAHRYASCDRLGWKGIHAIAGSTWIPVSVDKVFIARAKFLLQFSSPPVLCHIRDMLDGNSHKIFVLDTNVVLYDYRCIYSFEEHNVVIPITLLEEIDKFKRGNEIINYNAREFSRELDSLIGNEPAGRRRAPGRRRVPRRGHQREEGQVFERHLLGGQLGPPDPGPGLQPGRPVREGPGHPGVQGHQPPDEGQEHRRAARRTTRPARSRTSASSIPGRTSSRTWRRTSSTGSTARGPCRPAS